MESGNQERVLKLPGGVPVHVFGIFGEDHMFGRAAEYAIYKAEGTLAASTRQSTRPGW